MYLPFLIVCVGCSNACIVSLFFSHGTSPLKGKRMEAAPATVDKLVEAPGASKKK